MKDKIKEKLSEFNVLWTQIEAIINHSEGDLKDEFTAPSFGVYNRTEMVLLLQGKCRKVIREIYSMISQIDDINFFVDRRYSLSKVDEAFKLLELGNYGK